MPPQTRPLVLAHGFTNRLRWRQMVKRGQVSEALADAMVPDWRTPGQADVVRSAAIPLAPGLMEFDPNAPAGGDGRSKSIQFRMPTAPTVPYDDPNLTGYDYGEVPSVTSPRVTRAASESPVPLPASAPVPGAAPSPGLPRPSGMPPLAAPPTSPPLFPPSPPLFPPSPSPPGLSPEGVAGGPMSGQGHGGLLGELARQALSDRSASESVTAPTRFRVERRAAHTPVKTRLLRLLAT